MRSLGKMLSIFGKAVVPECPCEVGDIVSVKGEDWGMYVINVEGDNVSCVELDLILECKLEDIECE